MDNAIYRIKLLSVSTHGFFEALTLFLQTSTRVTSVTFFFFFCYLQDVMSPLDLSGKGHVDRAVAVRVFSRVRPPGMNTVSIC